MNSTAQLLTLDQRLVEQVLCAFIADQVHKNGFQNAVVGVSGGLDSAVVLALVQRALGAPHTFALLMPYRLSAPESLELGQTLCNELGVAHETIDISPSVDAYFDRFPATEKLQIGNKCARERMAVLYDFSSRRHALVAGTSNKSELLVGYSTLWGDSAAAFMPIGDLYKTQVFALARQLNIPAAIIARQPSADLWQNQTDEGELGITYKALDEILFLLIDRRLPPEQVAAQGHDAAAIERISRMIRNSQYKRTMPAVAKLQARTIGIDFRYPRDWGK